jgi:hypothetical protein
LGICSRSVVNAGAQRDFSRLHFDIEVKRNPRGLRDRHLLGPDIGRNLFGEGSFLNWMGGSDLWA